MGNTLTQQVSAAVGGTGLLGQPGIGHHVVGSCDIMSGDGPDGDVGVFARLFYPTEITYWSGYMEDTDEDTVTSLDTLEEELYAKSWPPWIEKKEYVTGLLLQLKTISKRAHWIAEWLIGERSDSLPVILFSHGVGSSRHLHSSLCASLASHGFLVAAIEHRDYSACWTYKIMKDPNNGSIQREKPITYMHVEESREQKIRAQQVHKRLSESVRLLNLLEEINLGLVNGTSSGSCDKKTEGSTLLIGGGVDWTAFKSRLDLGHVFMAGHGLGGSTAIATAAYTTDIQAAVVLDGYLAAVDADAFSRVLQPILYLSTSSSTALAPSKDTLMNENAKQESIKLATRRTSHSTTINISDTDTMCFTDLPLLIRPFLARRLRLAAGAEPSDVAELVLDTIRTFLTERTLWKYEVEEVNGPIWTLQRNFTVAYSSSQYYSKPCLSTMLVMTLNKLSFGNKDINEYLKKN